MEYVYITYKNDENFFINERELNIMNAFWNLEKTFGLKNKIKCEKMENNHFNKCIKDAIFVFSSLLNNIQTEQNSQQFFPFSYLYNSQFIEKSKKPRCPILINRNSSQIVLKLPPFVPLLSDFDINKNPKKFDIKKMAVYGKISDESKSQITENCIQLQNTGIRQQIGQTVIIKNLTENQKYQFAVAAFDATEELSGTIGENSEDIVCLNPLPVNLLCSHLAKHSYLIGDFETAETAADHRCKLY
ncbi:hypothetical protein IMG5_062970 [Ichthyophthirius multifiliis]|uniref:Uncharacterized protein n=1 Tax=Ichthyophthirius multifiliis TaxID=5932 RepID=G0QP12_ICHMU|nr:hypothetical protein IMG5_062970 [Ichthyophthirius multifiliis]EGR33042.1 hypothetical protein IMG5_062970 [Ichthyophthirius multifiliis]|eukprot:XP_004037028.1 hypothetical protein IMG5_062970 [Ichthyophthirius multifiliis]